jgi:hypothetical protein
VRFLKREPSPPEIGDRMRPAIDACKVEFGPDMDWSFQKALGVR